MNRKYCINDNYGDDYLYFYENEILYHYDFNQSFRDKDFQLKIQKYVYTYDGKIASLKSVTKWYKKNYSKGNVYNRSIIKLLEKELFYTELLDET